jgi:hypothetical protein
VAHTFRQRRPSHAPLPQPARSQVPRAKDAAELNATRGYLLAVGTLGVIEDRGIVLPFELAGVGGGFEFGGPTESIPGIEPGVEWWPAGPAGDCGPLLVLALRLGPMDYASAGP